MVADKLGRVPLAGLNSTRDTGFAGWDSGPEALDELAVGAAPPLVQKVVGCHEIAVDLVHHRRNRQKENTQRLAIVSGLGTVVDMTVAAAQLD